jgi:hypothetical protein
VASQVGLIALAVSLPRFLLTLELLGTGAVCFAFALALALVMLKGKPGHCQRAEVVPVSKHDREHDVHRG